MNGYSKIKLAHTTKSKSMDISDLQMFAQDPKPNKINIPNHIPKIQETKQTKTTNTKITTTHDQSSSSDAEDEDGINGERFGVILRRNSSVSANASHRFRFDHKQSIATTTTTLQSAVKRAFSMRRSSSVSERYCRIYDQTVTLSSPIDDVEDGFEGMDNKATMETGSVKKKKKQHRTGKILKACKSLFGL